MSIHSHLEPGFPAIGEPDAPSASLITTCKGRLEHLQQSLDGFLRQDYQGPWDVIVVDYGCPQNTFEFVRNCAGSQPRLKAIRVLDGSDTFQASRARNIGAAFARGEILAFVDVDHIPEPDFLTRGVTEMLEHGVSRTNVGDRDGYCGDVLLTRALFERLRGYDESFVGWGWEDIDLYARADAIGARTRLIPRTLLTLIHHEDDVRVRYHTEKDPQAAASRNFERSYARREVVNPEGFGDTTGFECCGLELPDGWRRLRDRYPWPQHRPLLPLDHQGWFGEGNSRLLAGWIGAHRPRLILEVGSWLGCSTRFFLEQAEQARVIAVDHWLGSPEWMNSPEMTLRLRQSFPQFQANCWDYRERVALCRNDSLTGMREIARLGFTPDLVYIDADHGREGVRQDVDLAATLFPRAALAGDDWSWEDADGPTVQSAVHHANRDGNYHLQIEQECWLLQPRN